MKKQILSLMALVIAVLVSCEAPTTTTPEEAPDYAAFDQKVETIRTFFKAQCDENVEGLAALMSDSIAWSPPYYNGNEYIGKTEALAMLKDYHANYDNIKFEEGMVDVDSTYGAFWSGSVFPEGDATTTPDLIRIYGTWTATHVASGQDVGIKFYALAGIDDAGKISFYSDYYDIASLMPKETAEE